MRPTKPVTMALTALTSGCVSWVILDLVSSRLGRWTMVPWTIPVLLVTVAIVILALAWPVRLYVTGKRRQVDRFRAATVLALGKACSLAGAALAGLYSGLTLVVLGQVNEGSPSSRVWACAAAALAAAVLAVAGRLVEWFCQLPPDDRAEKSGAKVAEPTPA